MNIEKNIKLWSSLGMRATFGLIAMELAKINSEKLIMIGKYIMSFILKIVSTRIELLKYVQLITHLGNIVAITKKNKKI